MTELTNQQILDTPKGLLTSIDKQKKFCIQMGLMHSPCPNCKTLQNVFEAARISINDYTFGVDDLQYICVNEGCKRKLLHHVPMFGPGIWYWGLD